MRLSISSSSSGGNALSGPEAPVPAGTLRGVGILTVLFLLVCELAWRSAGFVPFVSDDVNLWCYHRSRVYRDKGRRKIVILGTSRAQSGIDPAILSKALGNMPVVDLAVAATGPYGALQDLAADRDFDGIIVCGTTAEGFYPNNDLKKFVQTYHTRWMDGGRFGRAFELFLRCGAEQLLVVLNPVVSLKRQISEHFEIPAPYYRVLFNRFTPLFFSTVLDPDQIARLRQTRVHSLKYASADTASCGLDNRQKSWEALMRTDAAAIVRKLRSHGADIVFVRMPTTDEHWVLDDTRFPRTWYWDRISSLLLVPTIHFMDNPAMRRMLCPDTSHLDAQDVPVFTRELAKLLSELAILQSPEAQEKPL